MADPKGALTLGISSVLEGRGPSLTLVHPLHLMAPTLPAIIFSPCHTERPQQAHLPLSQVILFYFPSLTHLLLPSPLLLAFLTVSFFPNAFHSSKPVFRWHLLHEVLMEKYSLWGSQNISLSQNVALMRVRAYLSGSPCPGCHLA